MTLILNSGGVYDYSRDKRTFNLFSDFDGMFNQNTLILKMLQHDAHHHIINSSDTHSKCCCNS